MAWAPVSTLQLDCGIDIKEKRSQELSLLVVVLTSADEEKKSDDGNDDTEGCSARHDVSSVQQSK